MDYLVIDLMEHSILAQMHDVHKTIGVTPVVCVCITVTPVV